VKLTCCLWVFCIAQLTYDIIFFISVFTKLNLKRWVPTVSDPNWLGMKISRMSYQDLVHHLLPIKDPKQGCFVLIKKEGEEQNQCYGLRRPSQCFHQRYFLFIVWNLARFEYATFCIFLTFQCFILFQTWLISLKYLSKPTDFLAVINTCEEWNKLLHSKKTDRLMPLVSRLLF